MARWMDRTIDATASLLVSVALTIIVAVRGAVTEHIGVAIRADAIVAVDVADIVSQAAQAHAVVRAGVGTGDDRRVGRNAKTAHRLTLPLDVAGFVLVAVAAASPATVVAADPPRAVWLARPAFGVSHAIGAAATLQVSVALTVIVAID